MQVTQGGSTTESYSYDAVGNRLSSPGVPSYQYNASNELTSNSLGSYTYDNNGNTLTDAQGRRFTWDFENRLTQVAVPSTGTVAFKYDPFGRRIYKISPALSEAFAYEGYNLIETMDLSGTVLTDYTMTQEIDEPLATLRSGSSGYYEADVLGSITSLTSSTGSTPNAYIHDSYGNLMSFTATLQNPFIYTGREYDNETSFYFYRARYYDSAIGRFISEDPIGFIGSSNLYSYVRNSPMDLTDPLGLCPANRTREYLKCIASQGQAGSLQNILNRPNTLLWGALTGNDFSTLINIGLNSDLLNNLAQTLTSNPTPANLLNITAQLLLDLRTGTGRAILGQDGAGNPYVVDFIKDPVSASWGGKLLRGGLEVAGRGKLLWDAGATLRAIYVCAPVAANQ